MRLNVAAQAGDPRCYRSMLAQPPLLERIHVHTCLPFVEGHHFEHCCLRIFVVHLFSILAQIAIMTLSNRVF